MKGEEVRGDQERRKWKSSGERWAFYVSRSGLSPNMIMKKELYTWPTEKTK